MRLPGFSLPNVPQGPTAPDVSKPSLLDRILPPDPRAPERPTIPPPTCGTLPPELPALPDLPGKPRGRRSR
jgi:hypothetical protein